MQVRVPIIGVALLLGAACVSMGSSGSVPPATTGSPTPAPSPTPAGPPIALRADQASVWRADPGSWSVVLTWMPAPGFEADHYEVTRDGRLLEEAVVATRLVDEGVLPETTYRYGVTAVDAAGIRTETASVEAQTDAPAVEVARLQGRFRMQMHVVGQSGLQDHVGGGTMLFLFDPACADGPCDVRWRRRGRTGSGRLLRHGATYTGAPEATFQIRSCRGRRRKERLMFHIKVVNASAAHGRWLATRIQGRLHESAPAPGCVTARVRWRFAGVLQA